MSWKGGGRTVKDAEDARQCLAAAMAEGMTLYGWCTANNVAPSRLYRWRQRLAAAAVGEPQFVEVTAAAPVAPARPPAILQLAPPPVPPAAPPARYEVHVGGCHVVVGDDFRDEILARLLRVVRAC